MYPLPPIRVITVLGASILLGWSFQRTTWVVVVVRVVMGVPEGAPESAPAGAPEVTEVMEAGPELVGGGEAMLEPPLD